MPVLGTLPNVVDSLGVPGGIEVERKPSTGPDAFGDPNVGPLQRFRICPAIVQPATPRQMERLQPGDRSGGVMLVHTKSKLRTAIESRGAGADTVIYQPGGDAESLRYTVKVAGDWSIIGGFFACLATKQELD